MLLRRLRRLLRRPAPAGLFDGLVADLLGAWPLEPHEHPRPRLVTAA